jgi:hypothetical protein
MASGGGSIGAWRDGRVDAPEAGGSVTTIIEDPELGTMKVCTLCGEAWPFDEEFYYREGKGWTGWCRACWAERQREYRARRAVQ